jgi:hypothetical protein
MSKIALNVGKHISGNCSIRNGVFSTMPNLTNGSCGTPEVVGNFRKLREETSIPGGDRRE